MKLAVVLDRFSEVLSRIENGQTSRQYTYSLRDKTVGLCADCGPGTDIATIACSVADFMPTEYPPELAGPMALLIFADQSLRHLRRKFMAVEEQSIFAPSIAFAALHARVPIVSDVRYFDTTGTDKDPTTEQPNGPDLESVFIGGRSEAIEAYWRGAAWPRTGMIAHLTQPDRDIRRFGPATAATSHVALGSCDCVVEYWSG